MKNRKVNRTIQESDFTNLADIISKRNAKPAFRHAFSKEVNRLFLTHAVRELRQKNRLTQKQVADKAKMPQSVIARIESGSYGFSISTLQRIASVFGKQVGLVD